MRTRTARRRALLAATLPLAAAALAACSSATPSAAPAAPAPAAAPVAATTTGTAAACDAQVQVNAAIPPGIDPDGPPATPAELQAWADSIAIPFATLRDNAPAELADSVAVLGRTLEQARQGQPVSIEDEESNAAGTALNAWAYDSCGFQTLDLVSDGGALGPVPESLQAGPVAIRFRSSGDPAAFVVLLARVRDGEQATAAEVDAGTADFDAVAEVVTAAQPAGDEPGYGTAVLEPGNYLLTSPLGLPPASAGVSSVDLTVE
jgi:hypothetical protein